MGFYRFKISETKGGRALMIRFFQKPYRWARLYSLLLVFAFGLILLDAFVIPRVETQIQVPQQQEATQTPSAVTPRESGSPDSTGASEEPVGQTSTREPVITETSYEDENISIQIDTIRRYDTDIYVADIQIADVSDLRTALAGNAFGRNIKETTSAMAEEHNAILAVNGDYYGFRDDGAVVRNGAIYREGGGNDVLLIGSDGSFAVIDGADAVGEALSGAWQAFSFGPTLVLDGAACVDSGDEVGRSKASNPRTAIGQVGELHYLVIVSDGRTRQSAGLSLLELAGLFEEYGCETAYNLDGGGSSTMVFDGRVVNNPTNGRSEKEREVSDIVYIGYE